MAKKLYRERAFYAVPDKETIEPDSFKAVPEKQIEATIDLYTAPVDQVETSEVFCHISEENYEEPAVPIANTPKTDIYVSDTPAAIASVHVTASVGEAVLICACIHWKAASDFSSGTGTELLFKVRRDDPEVGTIIFSVKDSFISSSENRTTAFIHVDTGFEPSKDTKYTLTAEATAEGNRPQLVDTPIFTAVAMLKTYSIMP